MSSNSYHPIHTQLPTKNTRTSSNSNSNSSINLSPPDSRRNSIGSESESQQSTPKWAASSLKSNPESDDRYNIEEYYQVIKKLWDCNDKQLNTHVNFRTLVDFSLTHSLSLSNSQKRNITISDLSIFPLRQRSPTQAVALVVRSSSMSETPYLFYGCLRAKNVDLCPHAALAVYLFSRLHLPDSYGAIEITNDSMKNRNQQVIKTFNESRLLKGNNKLQSISYSQQHKSAVKALEISGISNFNQVNIGKFSSAQEPRLQVEALQKPASTSINGLPEEVLYTLAGFETIESYKIKRDVVEPPRELLNQIFPFINDDNFDIFDIFTIRIKNVLGMLRRSLVQDMVILKKEYPNNPICQHPIFNSELFNSFACELELRGGTTDQLSPTPSPKPFTANLNYKSGVAANHSQDQNQYYHELHNLVNLQLRNESKINYLQEQINHFIRNQADIYRDLQTFIYQQNEIYSKQTSSGFLPNSAMKDSSLPNTLDLISRLNSSQQNFFAIINNANIYNNDFQPAIPFQVSVKNQQEQHQSGVKRQSVEEQRPIQHIQSIQSIQSIPQGPIPPGPIQHPISQGIIQQVPIHPPPMFPVGAIPPPPHMTPSMGPSMQGQNYVGIPQPPYPIIPETESDIKRRKALHRRLSRQAINVYEMWDDFKSLENELEENEISVTEWLKLHGSSERQFRHTRQKIIKFVEQEAQRTNCPVEIIKDKLHNKMRNRHKPWTLDEVQRMLTSGRRINLD